MSGKKIISVKLDADLAELYLRGAHEAAVGMVNAVAHIDRAIQQALDAAKKPSGKKRKRSQ